MVRAKFKLNSVTQRLGSKAKYDEAGKHSGYEPCYMYDAKFQAVYSDKKNAENKMFWDATPSGEITLATIINMPWEIGKEYYVDFHEAPEA